MPGSGPLPTTTGAVARVSPASPCVVSQSNGGGQVTLPQSTSWPRKTPVRLAHAVWSTELQLPSARQQAPGCGQAAAAHVTPSPRYTPPPEEHCTVFCTRQEPSG